MFRRMRTELLAWLLVPLLAVAFFNVWIARRDAVETAGLITDRMLFASARVIAEQVKDTDGNVEALIPPAALEMFASPDRDRVVYRVTAPSGELIAGYPDVAVPPSVPSELAPVYFDAEFRKGPIRAVAIAQPVISARSSGHAIVVVGETVIGRDRMAASLWRRSVINQATLMGLVAILAVFGLRRALAPLKRLGKELAARDPLTFKPLSSGPVQVELQPLVLALNEALERVRDHISLQHRFIANASHQLRTPLALLKTQATVGIRETDPAAKNEALAAVDRNIDSLSRLANQLLTLAQAEPGAAPQPGTRIDLAALLPEAMAPLATIALERGIEMTLDIEDGPFLHVGQPVLLRELIVNLVENALKYTPSKGSISVLLRREGKSTVLCVEDNGPGIPASERERVFERFYRASTAVPGGNGLGLAIVREIVATHSGSVRLEAGGGGTGLLAIVTLPST
jgi:two-component system, OmpR family, sensor histidine kinase TctE